MNTKRMSVNLVSSLVNFAVALLIGFLLPPFIVKNVGKEAYGFIGLAQSIVSYGVVFTTALNSVSSRFLSISLHEGDIKRANTYFSSIVIANSVIAGILLIPGIIMVIFTEYLIDVPEQLKNDIKILLSFLIACLVINAAANIFGNSAYIQNRLDLSSKISIKSNILKLIVLFIAYTLLKPALWYVGFASLVSTIYTVLKNVGLWHKLTPELYISTSNFRRNAIREVLAVGIWNTVNNLNVILSTGLDLLYANLFLGPIETTFLSIAKTLPGVMQSLFDAISNVFSPTMTILYAKGDMKGFLSETLIAIKIVGFIGSVPMLGLMFFGKEFLALWQTSLEETEIDKIFVLMILTLLVLMGRAYIYPLHIINTITAKLKIPVLINLFIGLINIIVVYILLKYTDYGSYAIAGVSSILLLFRFVLFTPLYSAYILNLPKYTFYKPMFRGLISSLVIGGLYVVSVSKLDIINWRTLIFYTLIFGIFGYIISFVILFDKREKKKVIYVLQKKLTRH